MKILVALMVVLAFVGTSMAWNINEELQYTYTKSAYQQAGSDLVMPQIVKAESMACFQNPNYYGNYTAGQVYNQLGNVTLDRTIFQPPIDLTYADFYATLTQGGSASMYKQSIDAVDNSVPEISGKAEAYQNLWLKGGFDQVSAEFESQAIVGTFGPDPATNHWVVSQTSPDTMASVDAETHGSGEFIKAYMGEKVKADIQQNYMGSGWAEPTYSGGIEMWAGFVDGCDPHCSNPVISTVSGSAATALFPGDIDKMPEGLGTGEEFYWGPGWDDFSGDCGIPNPDVQNLDVQTGDDGMYDTPSEGEPDDVLYDP